MSVVVLPCTGSSHPPTHWLPDLIFFHALFTAWTAAFLFLASFHTVAQKKTHTMKIEQRVFINKKTHESHHILRRKKS
jgi:hypothetical protein